MQQNINNQHSRKRQKQYKPHQTHFEIPTKAAQKSKLEDIGRMEQPI